MDDVEIPSTSTKNCSLESYQELRAILQNTYDQSEQHAESDVEEELRCQNIFLKTLTVLEEIDTRVEDFRSSALDLQEKKESLATCLDIVRSDTWMEQLSEPENNEIESYIRRVDGRLGTVVLHVRTVRDPAQQEALSEVNVFIDGLIATTDPVIAKTICQQYLNACSPCNSCDQNDGNMDKNFENALLGCTLDDQKVVKKRLLALIAYLNRQTSQ